MNDYDHLIGTLREAMKKTRAVRHPIQNELLAQQGEEVKTLYLGMLYSILCYMGAPSESQHLYLHRLIKGIDAQEEPEEYMACAMSIDEDFLKHFLDIFHGDALRFYFCVDGAILVSLGEQEEGQRRGWEYLAELLEALGLQQLEVSSLTCVAQAILTQNQTAFDCARDHMRNELSLELDWRGYLRGFYEGKIADTGKLLHFYSADRQDLAWPGSVFSDKTVVFEHARLKLMGSLSFRNCPEVRFVDCEILNDENTIFFSDVARICFENCTIRGAKQRFAKIAAAESIRMIGCEVTDCEAVSPDDYNCGGIIGLVEGREIEELELRGNLFRSCVFKTRSSSWDISGAIMGTDYAARWVTVKKFILIKNRFDDCGLDRERQNWPAALFYEHNMKIGERAVEENAVNNDMPLFAGG